ncbi:hypothetical protein M5689_001355 [Euphorbia peplus]|nr:hypothetical protein M5689_001355 [Euphorbia peplus]
MKGSSSFFFFFIIVHSHFIFQLTRAQNQNPFNLPSPLPLWPSGGGFGGGTIDIGGLQVRQISSLSKIWATHEGGPNNVGASFYDPVQLPQGFIMLGCYAQSNIAPLYGWVLAAKDDKSGTLSKPVDYTLIWSSESLKINQDGFGYFWLPTAPNGYKSTGLVVTNSSAKPSVEKVRCVRSDLTDQYQTDMWIWGPGKGIDPNGFSIFSVRPTNRGTQAMSVSVGTFWAQNGNVNLINNMSCLKNVNPKNLSYMPNLTQVQAIFKAYSPLIYFHPDEIYLSSSVNWFFTNGALLYKRGNESNPVAINPTGSNLPQSGSDDGEYWLDLPVDGNSKERVKKGDLQGSEVYLHVKPMFGATFTDIAIWVFCPFNGPVKAKIGPINTELGKIGQHVGDWEHITLRVSNFNGELKSVYFSQHSGGIWFSASELEYQNGNKFAVYSSLHGHAMYPKPGVIMRGSGGIGIRSIDTARSDFILDSGAKFSVMSGEYLGRENVEEGWVNYMRKWGPKINYDVNDEIRKVGKVLIGKLKSEFEKFVHSLPNEVLGEDGPTGPKVKFSWNGDEVC